MGDTRARAQAHAKRGYFCNCGRVVHGNGARAMHFYKGGDRYAGRREGHVEIGHDAYFVLHGHPLDHPANKQKARTRALPREPVAVGQVWQHKREPRRKLTIVSVDFDAGRVYPARNTSRRTQSLSLQSLYKTYRLVLA